MTSPAAPLDRALETVAGLKPGTWEAVEAYAVLSLAARGRPEAATLLAAAEQAAAGMKAGTWHSVTALAWLHLAREGSDPTP